MAVISKVELARQHHGHHAVHVLDMRLKDVVQGDAMRRLKATTVVIRAPS